MKDYKEAIEKEAKEYAKQMWGIYVDDLDANCEDKTIGEISEQDFISGVNSKITERIKIEFAISILKEILESKVAFTICEDYILNKISELENKLI